MSLCEEGYVVASFIVKNVTSRSHNESMKLLIAFPVFVELELSRTQYEIIRNSVKNCTLIK